MRRATRPCIHADGRSMENCSRRSPRTSTPPTPPHSRHRCAQRTLSLRVWTWIFASDFCLRFITTAARPKRAHQSRERVTTSLKISASKIGGCMSDRAGFPPLMTKPRVSHRREKRKSPSRLEILTREAPIERDTATRAATIGEPLLMRPPRSTK